MTHRVAVVTGSYRGIGLAVVQKLCQQFPGTVYLTARNAILGQKSTDFLRSNLKDQKCEAIKFHVLDITDRASVESLKDQLKSEHGGLDILVNNAAIAYIMERAKGVPFPEQVEKTMNTNYFGTRIVCDALFPILRPHSRVVHISSTIGLLKQVTEDSSLKKKLQSSDLSLTELDDIVRKYIELAKSGCHKEHGYSDSSYGMSKVFTTALASVQQKLFDRSADPRSIIINACCPGYVNTEMTFGRGALTPEQGAETPVYLCLLAEGAGAPRGALVYLKKEISWIDGRPL